MRALRFDPQFSPGSREFAVTVEPVADTIVDELGRLWAEHDLDELTSDAVKYLTAGSATDWGMPATVQSPIPPISLGGGIPDPDTLPRAELLAAMDRALDVPDDSPLRYGGGIGARYFLIENVDLDLSLDWDNRNTAQEGYDTTQFVGTFGVTIYFR